MKNIFWKLSIATILLATMSVPILMLAQEQEGSISGTVYRDINANGVCVNEGEPRVAANIPMELVADDAGELIRITTAADGSFFYSTDTVGLWRVTVVPGQGWRITSQQTLEIVLSEDNPDATSVDFCIIEIDQATGGGTTLPESGAAMAPILMMIASLGFILIAAGAVFLLIGRSQKA